MKGNKADLKIKEDKIDFTSIIAPSKNNKTLYESCALR